MKNRNTVPGYLNSTNVRFLIPLFLILGFTFLMVIILLFPNYFSDDFLVFNLVKQNYFDFLKGVENEYFLKTRPLSYLVFQLYSQLLQSSILMKMFNGGFYLVFIWVTFFTFKNLLELFNSTGKYVDVILVLTLIFLNPDNLIMVFWISNLTELYSLLFYSISIFYFLKWIRNLNSTKYYILGLLSFIISLLFKQQGLHIPLLLIFYFYFLSSNLKIREKENLFIAILVIVFLIFSIWNWVEYRSFTNQAFSNIWKKPFAIIGTFIYVINPIVGKTLYDFFIIYKKIAFIFMLVLTSGFIYSVFKNWIKLSFKKLSPYLIFVLIILYPRIFAQGGGRLNSILIFWFAFLLLILVSKNIKYSKSILIILIAVNFISTFILIGNWKLEEAKRRQVIFQLSDFVAKIDKPVIIICSPFYKEIIYESYFVKKKVFGADNKINFGGCKTLNAWGESKKYLFIKKYDSNHITIKSTIASIVFEYYPNNNFTKSIKTKLSSIGKFDSQITIKIKEESIKKYILIFYDGLNWREIP